MNPTNGIDLNQSFYNEDCIIGCRRHIPDGAVDLIVTDPPYGINGHQLHKHYNRKEAFVLDGYIEVPAGEYRDFSCQWIAEAERILRPGGSIYIVSGYTNLVDILTALRDTSLQEVNHIIWKYNFGVYTRNKYISSHYHILYYVKPGADRPSTPSAAMGPARQTAVAAPPTTSTARTSGPLIASTSPAEPRTRTNCPPNCSSR